jgi:tRNA modification GTPase
VKKLNLEKYSGDQAIVSNVRHCEILRKMSETIIEVKNNIEIGITKDLISIDLKVILDQIGMITGEVSNEEVLGNIFSRFCIGK